MLQTLKKRYSPKSPPLAYSGNTAASRMSIRSLASSPLFYKLRKKKEGSGLVHPPGTITGIACIEEEQNIHTHTTKLCSIWRHSTSISTHSQIRVIRDGAAGSNEDGPQCHKQQAAVGDSDTLRRSRSPARQVGGIELLRRQNGSVIQLYFLGHCTTTTCMSNRSALPLRMRKSLGNTCSAFRTPNHPKEILQQFGEVEVSHCCTKSSVKVQEDRAGSRLLVCSRKIPQMTTHSPELQWLLLRNCSSFHIRRKTGKAVTFTTVGVLPLIVSNSHPAPFPFSGTLQPHQQKLLQTMWDRQ